LIVRLFFTRRNFLTTGVGALVTAAELRGQSEQIPVAGVPVKEFKPRSTVALVAGEDRRKTVYNALVAIDDQILPKLKTKQRVLIKPNDVNPSNQLACTHADALRGILDYLAPRFKGQVTIGETLGGGFKAYQGLQYPDVIKEYKNFRGLELVDFRIRTNGSHSRCSTRTRTSFRFAWRPHCSMRTPSSSERRC
jgi:hypothetical protein